MLCSISCGVPWVEEERTGSSSGVSEGSRWRREGGYRKEIKMALVK